MKRLLIAMGAANPYDRERLFKDSVNRVRPHADNPETEPSTRLVRYALDDPLLRFWFRFVFPHQSVLRLLGPARGFVEVVRPEFDAYFGRCFERLCRESLPLLYLREGVRAPFTVGEYPDSEVEVDVVGVRQDNWTDHQQSDRWSLPAVPAEVRTAHAE